MIYILALVLVIGLIYWLFLSPYSQIFGKYPYRLKTNKKVVALTFDDGPNEPYTTQIVDYLNSKKIKATFFQVGKCVQRNPDVTKKIYTSGHTIGIHSLSHEFHKYFTQPGFEQEILESRRIIADVIGQAPVLIRFPWLMRHPLILGTARKMGLHPVSGVFCSSLEVFQINGSTIAKHALSKIKPGSIIIFHDGYDAKGGNRSQTVKAVKLVADELIKQGYEFKTVDSLLGLKAYN